MSKRIGKLCLEHRKRKIVRLPLLRKNEVPVPVKRSSFSVYSMDYGQRVCQYEAIYYDHDRFWVKKRIQCAMQNNEKVKK